MVALLESVAQQIGYTIDDKWEALLFVTFRGKADALYCSLSPYAQDVFRLVDRICLP